jgi:hypothetical protein
MNATIDLLRDGRAVATPWGMADFATELAPGIVSYSTPSHGGIKLSAQRLAELKPELRAHKPFCGQDGWYEEDCDWAIVAMQWPELFNAENIETAKMIAAKYIFKGEKVEAA